METWEAITSRRNLREFADKPISDTDLNRILEAGRIAPSARNTQPWDFVVVTDREQLKELSGVWRGGGHIAQAGAAIAIVISAEDAESSIVRFDLGQASLQMQVTAADLGIGHGHSSIGDQDLARRVLGLPAEKVVGLINDYGYAVGGPLKPIRKYNRRPFDEVVHRGRW